MIKINNDLTVSTEFLYEVQREIVVWFSNPSFLIEALLHPSFFNGDKVKQDAFKQKNCLENESYETLEHRGDSALSYIITEYLCNNKEIQDYVKNKGKTKESFLTEIKQVLVSNKNLTLLGQKLNLDKYILQQGLENVECVYANVVEAIIGAISRSEGDTEVKRFVYYFFDIKGALGKVDSSNPIGKLQEMCMKKGQVLKYDLISEEGPDHKKQFTYLLSINGYHGSYGHGLSKKDAKKDAAEKYLQSLDEK